jgi:hypothetical protein
VYGVLPLLDGPGSAPGFWNARFRELFVMRGASGTQDWLRLFRLYARLYERKIV